MRILYNLLLIVLVVLAIGDVFWWIMATGSGHSLENSTHALFFAIFLVLSVSIVLLIRMKKWLKM